MIAFAGDTSALSPGGVRIGSPALTTRGLKEGDFEKVADFLHEAVQLCARIQERAGKPLRTFIESSEKDEEFAAYIKDMRKRVGEFATSFGMPGFDVSSMKYTEVSGCE